MFPLNGKNFLRAVKANRMTALDAVAALIEGGHDKALGQLMAQGDLFNAETRKAAFDKVIAARKLEAFQAMYNNDPYSRGANQPRKRLILQLHEAGWQEALNVVLQRAGYVYPDDLVKFVSDHDLPADCRTALIKNHSNVSARDLLTSATRHAPSWLAHYLDTLDYRPDANTLAGYGVSVLSNGHDAEVATAAFNDLLRRGLNVNYENGAVMTAALSGGYLDLAQALVDHGFEASLCRTAVYERLCAIGAPREGIAFIKQFMGSVAADTGEAQTHGGFVRADEYSMSRIQQLPGGGQLTMLFNFATAQQVMIAQMDGHIASPSVVAFSQIENRHLLEKAADAFIAAGGDAGLVTGVASQQRKTVVTKPHGREGQA